MVVWRCLLSLLTLPRNIYPACQSFSKPLSSSEIPSTRFLLTLSSLPYLPFLTFLFLSSLSFISPCLLIFLFYSLSSSFSFVAFLLLYTCLFPSLFLLPLLFLYYLHIIFSFLPSFISSLLHQITLSSLFHSILFSCSILSQSFSFPFRLVQSYSKPHNKSKQDKIYHCTT